MIHRLKTIPSIFEAVWRGDKNFEIRYNRHRGFQKKDVVILYDGVEEGENYRHVMVEITYVSNFNQEKDWVVFGFFVISRHDKEGNTVEQ